MLKLNGTTGVDKLQDNAGLPGGCLWDAQGMLTLTNDIVFTKVGPRFLADMSNATLSSRFAFQTSTPNNSTVLGILPSGAGQNAALNMYGNPDPDNAPFFRVAMLNASQFADINSGKTGTGTTRAMTFSIDDIFAMSIGTGRDISLGNYNAQPTTSTVLVRRNNAGGSFNNAHVELQATAGNVYLSWHAAGNTAAQIRHIRGEDGLGVVNSANSAFAIIRASAFTVNSDYRVKENIQPLTDGLERLKKLSPKKFAYKPDSMMYTGGTLVDGFLAHEVAEVVPNAVDGEKDGLLPDGEMALQTMDASKLVPLLVAAVQDLAKIVEDQQQKIAQLEALK